MKMTMKWLVLPLAASVLLLGCKSKQQKIGDEALAAGKLTNAITFYAKAEQNGDTSAELYHNFALAYLRQSVLTAKKDPMSNVVYSYLEQVDKYLANCTDPKIMEEYATTVASLGAAQALTDGDYEFILRGFGNLKKAEEISAKNGKVGAAAIQGFRDQAEKKYIGNVLKNASSIENGVAKEYELLSAEVVSPNNVELRKALNEVRKKNRGDFLIFEAAGVESPSRWVNKYNYVLAFPSMTLSPTGAKGELQVWNSTGNNSELDGNTFKMVSVDGKEVVVNKGVTGWCSGPNALKPTKEKFVDGKGKSLSEGTCSVQVSFTYPQGFVADYVEYKDKFGIGRKYFGQ